MSRANAGVPLLAALCAAGVASAQEAPGQPISLTWRAPAGCPAAAAIHAEIERALGGPPDPASPRFLIIDAEISPAPGGWRVRLTTDMAGSIGERQIEAPTCAALGGAAALVIAMTFDPEAVARQTSAPVETESGAQQAPVGASPESRAAVAPAFAAAPPPAAPPPDRGRTRLPRPGRASPRIAVGTTIAGSIGALPGGGYALAGGLGVVGRTARVDVEIAFWPDRPASVPGRESAGGEFSLVAGAARGCWLAMSLPIEASQRRGVSSSGAKSRTSIEIGPCGGVEVGSMSAAGFGVRTPTAGSGLWLAPSVAAAAAFPLGDAGGLRLDLGMVAPLYRPRFVLEGIGDVFRSSPLVGRAALGAEVRF